MKRVVTIHTKEEIARDKERLLPMFKAGMSMHRISLNENITKDYVRKLRDLLIEDGLITKQEIDEALANYLKEHPSTDGINNEKAPIKTDTKKSEQKKQQSLEKRQRILELIKAGWTKLRIANELEITTGAVNHHIKKLINEGLIKEDDVPKFTKDSEIVVIDRTTIEYNRNINAVVYYLKRGWNPGMIRKHLEITPFDMQVYIKDIKNKGIMTSEEIAEAKSQKLESDLQFVADCVNQGYSIQEIRDMRPDFPHNVTTPIIDRLIKDGRITRQQVEENGKKHRRKLMSKDYEMSLDDQFEFVIDRLKKGYGLTEIVNEDQTNSITMSRAGYFKQKAIKIGKISQEEIDTANNNRKQELLEEKQTRAIETVKKYLEQGYHLTEIAGRTEYSHARLQELIRDYKKGHEWYSQEELEEFKRLRAQKEKEGKVEIISEYMTKKNERRSKQAEITAKTEAKVIRIVKKYIKMGYNISEIAPCTGYSFSYVDQIVNRYIKSHKWFTDEEIEVFKANRKEGDYENLPKPMVEYLLNKEKSQERAAEKRKANVQDRRVGQSREVLEYVEQGYFLHEIAEKMNCHIETVRKIKRYCIENNIWPSEDKIKAFQVQRKMKEIEEDPEKREKYVKRIQATIEKGARKKERKDRMEQDTIKMVKYIKNGYTYKEIAKMLNRSINGVIKLRDNYKKANGWFTDKQIKRFKKNRIKREEEQRQKLAEKEKRKAEAAERIKQVFDEEQRRKDEKRELKEQAEKDAQEARKEAQRRRLFAQEYIEARKAAKLEEKKEYGQYGSIVKDAIIAAREKFLRYMVDAKEHHYNVSQKDIEFALNFLTFHPKSARADVLKMMINRTFENEGIEEAEKMVTELTRELMTTKYHDPLVYYGSWLRKKKNLPEAMRMRRSGMTDEQIYAKLRISSAEIALLSDKSTKIPIFPEEIE